MGILTSGRRNGRALESPRKHSWWRFHGGHEMLLERAAPVVEQLEERQMLAISTFAAGLLTVVADPLFNENVTISAAGGNVKVNGADPLFGAVPASAVTGMILTGGLGANVFDLTPVQRLQTFTNLSAISVTGGLGNDMLKLHTQSGYNDKIDITASTISMSLNVGSGVSVSIGYSGINSLLVYSAGGADTITVTEPILGSMPNTIEIQSQDESDIIEVNLAPNGSNTTYIVDADGGANDRFSYFTRSAGDDTVTATQTQFIARLADGSVKSASYTGVEYLQVFTDAGNDSVVVTEPANGVFPATISVEGQSGNDSVTVNHGIATFATLYGVNLGNDPDDRLTVNTASGHSDSVTLIAPTVRTQLGPNPATKPQKVIVQTGVDWLTVRTAGGGDTITVHEPASGSLAPIVDLQGQDEDDFIEINLATNGSASNYNVDLGAGANDIFGVFTRSAGADIVAVSSTQVAATLPSTPTKTASYAGVEYLQVFTSGGNDSVSITEPASGPFPPLVLADTETGNDEVILNLALATLATTHVVLLGADPLDRLVVNTQSAASDSVTLSSNGTMMTTTARLGPGNPTKTILHSGTDSITIDTAAGNDTINVTEPTSGAFPAKVIAQTGDGDDSVSLSLLLASAGTIYAALLDNGTDDRLEVKLLGGYDDLVGIRDVALEARLGPNPTSSPVKSVMLAGLERLAVSTAGGHDRITSTSSLGATISGGGENDTILGGPGPDSLLGEAGADILVGGQGNDTLEGGAGRDLLFGGEGSDSFFGGDDQDIVLASPSIYDWDIAALGEIHEEWRRTDVDFATRLAHLQGTPGGLNDGIYLKAAPDDSTTSNYGQTIYNDLATDDELRGGGDVDWFLLHDGTTPDRVGVEPRTNLGASTVPPLAQMDEGPSHSANPVFLEPPAPSIAVGLNHVVTVMNKLVRFETKNFTHETTQSLAAFFGPLNPASNITSPQALYDTYQQRYIIVAIDGLGASPGRLLLAISDDSDPNGTWYYRAIPASVVIGSETTFPRSFNLGVGSEALYIMAEMHGTVVNGFHGSRLWIVNKSPLYSGGSAPDDARVFDPSTEVGLNRQAVYLQPVQAYGTLPAGVGTFLVATRYWDSGATWNYRLGSNDALLVIRIDHPLAATPTFAGQLVDIGNDIDPNFGNLPLAQQAGGTNGIGTGDNRIASAIWRNGNLWLANSINPIGTADDGQATVRWYRLNTASLGALAIAEMGLVTGEDIAPRTSTFYPSLAVDTGGNLAIGFSASAGADTSLGSQGIFASAYYAFRLAGDPGTSLRTSGLLAAGLARYGTSNGPWGPYSGLVIDPTSNETFSRFWVFNQYALAPQGNAGRWGTRLGALVVDV
ncbi:MAG: hypothetical protein KF708_00300 [Pirellulales bacterium]|nr:hypothetical protein [Pirellulales bacterium]